MVLQDKEQNFGIISKTQTAGYGQRGHFWESPSGGLWCSLALKPEINPRRMGLIPILCALSVAKALKSYHISTRLKWPNDILHSTDNKKLGGIIVEGKVSRKDVEYLIIGIGININTYLKQYSLPLRKDITSTLEITKTHIELEPLLHKIINSLERGFNNMARGEEGDILLEWKKWDNILGRKITITSNNIEFEGIAKDLTKYGQIILELDDGREISFASGNLSLL